MKLSEKEIRKWVLEISDDYMHFSPEHFERIVQLGSALESEVMFDGGGVISWITVIDFDCKKKLNVVLFYCRPEKRGRAFIPMLRRIEEIAKQEGAEKIIIGCSISGYKEEKFNRILTRFGYGYCGYTKEVK